MCTDLNMYTRLIWPFCFRAPSVQTMIASVNWDEAGEARRTPPGTCGPPGQSTGSAAPGVEGDS